MLLRVAMPVIDVDECRRFFLFSKRATTSTAVKAAALLASALLALANSAFSALSGKFAIDSPLYDRRVNDQRVYAVHIGLTESDWSRSVLV